MSQAIQNDEHKWQLLSDMPRIDANNPKLQRIAEQLWSISMRRPKVYLRLAFALAKDGISYESDIKQFGHEDISGVTRYPEPDDAIDAFERGSDDCDAKARFFVALCLAKGFRARLWPLWKNGVLTHVAAEVEVNNQWVHAETILSRARLGEMHTDVPKELKSGKWRMA
jgi:transglutaminase-like putative cysteine protease